MKHLLAIALALAPPTGAIAQHAHVTGSDHASTSVTEPGQGAFASIAEITDVLRADPKTDWPRVNIAALRVHLVDMSLLTLSAKVLAKETPRGASFDVTGDDRTAQAIKAMVPAHAPFLEAETGWEVTVDLTDNGAMMQVLGDAQQIRALGFSGLMAIGGHHQSHHLAIARGGSAH